MAFPLQFPSRSFHIPGHTIPRLPFLSGKQTDKSNKQTNQKFLKGQKQETHRQRYTGKCVHVHTHTTKIHNNTKLETIMHKQKVLK